MTDVNSLISKRFTAHRSTKMDALATKRNAGELSSFSGVFTASELDAKETNALTEILKNYSSDGECLNSDLEALSNLTSEIKAIRNQAALLHGERIQRAQTLLKDYKEGAFTAFLLAVYGNRQTPYNFLQYFLLYSSLPKKLHAQAESMPRQAIYTLASRKGSLDIKREVIETYQGETKDELLKKIRLLFPLSEEDKRGPNSFKKVISSLKILQEDVKNLSINWTNTEKSALHSLLDGFKNSIFGGQ
jgi:hypothetical protein